MQKPQGTMLFAWLAMLALLALVGCEGEAGPAGPEGPQGPQGPQGPPGEVTRTVMSGTVPDEAFDHFVSIPELDIEDPPLVSVFVQLTNVEYDELPIYWEDFSTQPLWASIQDGGVTLYNCQALPYIIVILE